MEGGRAESFVEHKSSEVDSGHLSVQSVCEYGLFGGAGTLRNVPDYPLPGRIVDCIIAKSRKSNKTYRFERHVIVEVYRESIGTRNKTVLIGFYI